MKSQNNHHKQNSLYIKGKILYQHDWEKCERHLSGLKVFRICLKRKFAIYWIYWQPYNKNFLWSGEWTSGFQKMEESTSCGIIEHLNSVHYGLF